MENKDSGFNIPTEIFDTIARTRTELAIFPNMHTLYWGGLVKDCVVFMHRGVTSFTVRTQTAMSLELATSFFCDVVNRMPNITKFHFAAPMSNVEIPAVALFRGLSKLQTVSLPLFSFTTDMAECLSRLNNLRAIEFNLCDSPKLCNPEDIVRFQPTLVEGAFPSLLVLSVAAPYENVAEFLTQPFAPVDLTTIIIDSPVFETPAVIRNFFSMIASTHPQLETLHMFSSFPASPNPEQSPSKDLCINLNTLEPLFQCSKLINLTVLHQHPVDLREEELETIAKAWPLIEELILNDDPSHLLESNFTLKALLPFAHHCPELRSLGLFLDASVEIPSSLGPLPIFKKLDKLSMGVSIISEYRSVALFLSQICPEHCVVDCGIGSTDERPRTESTRRAIDARADLWWEAGEVLPLLVKARIQERERFQASRTCKCGTAY